MKRFVLHAAGLVLLWWCLSVFFVPGTYPPRDVTMREYVFIFLIGGSTALLARASVPWRYGVYYAILAALPEMAAVIARAGSNCRIRSMTGGNLPVVAALLPVAGMLALLSAVAAGAAHAASMRSPEDSANAAGPASRNGTMAP